MLKTERFNFFPLDGQSITFDLSGVEGVTGRVSRSGLRVMVFPSPYTSLQITEGERVGPAKMARIREAVAALAGK